MARPLEPSALETAAFHGEISTDGRCYATVSLPAEAGPLEPPVEYELQDLEPPSTTRVTGELKDGRFTIHTDEPHVKVAWRINGHRPASDASQSTQEEGDDMTRGLSPSPPPANFSTSTEKDMNKTVITAALAAVLALVVMAAGSASADSAFHNRVSVVGNEFVADANRGDYAAACRLYSTRYLKVSRAVCRSLYQWEAHIYGPFDYRIVRRRRLESGHWRFDLIRWRHPSFIELASERDGWRIVAGGW